MAIDTTKITSYSAVEFTALPSKWSLSVIINGKTIKGLVSAVEYTGDPETCPCVSVQPACNMTAVSSATRPTKPLAAAGATCSRGERDMRRGSKCCRSAFLALINIHLVCFKVFRWHGQTQTGVAGLRLFSGGIAGHGGGICAYLPYFDTHASILFYMGRAMMQPVRTTPGLRPPPAPLSHRRSRT